MQYRIGICDDEELMININSLYIKDIAKKLDLDIILHTFSSGEDLLAYADSHPLDIAFLDIDMDGISGISAAFSLRKKYPNIVTIFITGHSEYALEAFDTDAAGYLVKPLNPEKLEYSLKKAIKYTKLAKKATISKYITITEDNIKKKLPQYQIIYFEKEGNQCKVVTTKETHYWYVTIKSILQLLDDDFIQVNQGVIVNHIYIKSIIKDSIVLKDGSSFQIGRKYLPLVKERFFTLSD